MSTGASLISSARKPNPKVALINLPEPDSTILRGCFREFSIQAIMLSGIGLERLKTQKFEGCVLRLSEEAEPLLEALRTVPLNKRTVVYGICGGAGDLARFFKYGINALLSDPLDSESVTGVVRATHLLVRGELRCYVRLALVTEVLVTAKDTTHSTVSQEISAGGMSLKATADFPPVQAVQLSFSLPSTSQIVLNAQVCWRQPDNRVGVRFDRSKERETVRKWIEEYLEIR